MMKHIEFTYENMNLTIFVPENQEQEAQAFLSMAGQMPVTVALNGKQFVLMEEEEFATLLEYEDEYAIEDYDEEALFSGTAETVVTDNALGSVLRVLEITPFDSQQLSHLKEVVDSHHTIACAREVYCEVDE